MDFIKSAWDFFQNEILGMGWLNRLISGILNACGLDTTGKIGGSVLFFIYDTIKILFLLGVLILYRTFKAISRQSGQRRFSDDFTGSAQTVSLLCWGL